MNEPRFHSEARIELLKSARFYEGERRGLGESFTVEVERAIGFILANPRAGTPIWNHFRSVLVRRFPYATIYRALGDTVYIIAVAHQHRHPQLLAEKKVNAAHVVLVSARRGP